MNNASVGAKTNFDDWSGAAATESGS